MKKVKIRIVKTRFKYAIKLLLIMILMHSSEAFSQSEFFRSKISFSESKLSEFYSAISIDSNQIYFNANDYYLHALDKKSGEIKWSHYLANKSNNKPILYKETLLVGKHLSEYTDRCIQLNSKTGDLIKTLKIDKFETNPIIKGNIVFGTAINPEIGGAILAYDLDQNNIIWQQFVAHGVSNQPYFCKNKIVANAENNNWFEIDYNGNLKDTLCKNKASIFVENIKCVKKYTLLTHDEKELDDSFLNKTLKKTKNIIQKNNDQTTILLAGDKILIIGNNKKIKQKVDLTKINLPIDTENNEYKEILKIEEHTIWFFYENLLIAYDFKTKRTSKIYDLTQWNVHQIELEPDNSKVWLISKNDGQLYGLNLDAKLD